MSFKVFAPSRKSVRAEIVHATKPVLETLEGRVMLSTHRHRTATTPTERLTGGEVWVPGSPTDHITRTDILNTYGLGKLSAYSDQYPLYTNRGDYQSIVVIGPAAPYVDDVPGTGGRTGNINQFSTAEGILGDNPIVDPVGAVDETGDSDPQGALFSTMELEWAHAMAPEANIIFVEVPSVNGVVPYGDMELGIQEAVKDLQNGTGYTAAPGPIDQQLPGGIVDLGLTSTGEDPTIDAQFEKLFSYKYAADVSFIAPAGDTGGLVSMPADSPWVTSVGGTTFNYLRTVNGKNPQTAALNAGGGPSGVEALPSFQKGIKVNGKALTTRSGPDLAMADATNAGGVYVYYDPTLTNNAPVKTYEVNGTEVGAALMSGAVADLDELRMSIGQGPIGRDLNNEMYALYKQNSSLYFTDITQGNNTLYQAYRGFDYATGMGSPNFDQLIPALAGVPAIQSKTVTLNGDFYQSLADGAVTGNAITPFTGFGNVLIANNYIDLQGNLTNTTTITQGGATVTEKNTITLTIPNEIVRNVDNTFATRATAQVVDDGQAFDFAILITGRVTGSGTDEGVTGSFYTIDRRGKRISPGTYAIVQGSFRSS